MKLKPLKNSFLLIVSACLLNACVNESSTTENTNLQQEPVKTEELQAAEADDHAAEQEPVKAEESPAVAIATEEDPEIALAKELINTGKDIAMVAINTHAIKDSIRKANRESVFVYQIGFPFIHEEDIFDAVHKLMDMENISVFKKSRKEYYIIKNDLKSEEELRAGLAEFNKELAYTGFKAKVINLSGFCGKKEIPMSDGKITKRKEALQLDCLTCK